ncbi:MAG: 3-isopropylmalate dehydrogenase, partial [Thermoanaerobaculia bacterium]
MRIAVVPGDGIGPEVTREALKVLDSLRSDTLGRRRGHASGPDLYIEVSV